MSGETYLRQDISAVGELLKITNDQDGDVFMIARYFFGKLYMLLRCINYVNAIPTKKGGGNSYITLVNEYAWHEVGITFYVSDVMNINFDQLSSDKIYWVADYFKWQKVDNGINFLICDKNGNKRIISGISNPILKFQISQRSNNACGDLGCKKSYEYDLKNQWYFQPAFYAGDGNTDGFLPTFYDANIPYPGGINQASGWSYKGFLQTNMPPGIDVHILDTTKLWTGVEYNTNISAQAYTNSSGPDNDRQDGSTRFFAREMYYYALQELNSNAAQQKDYNGLPSYAYRTSFNENYTNQNNDTNSMQFYNNGSHTGSCGGLACEHIITSSGADYDKYGFKFFLLPLNAFTSKNTEGFSEGDTFTRGLYNPVYHICPQYTLYDPFVSNYTFYQNFCKYGNDTINNFIPGFTNQNDAFFNKNTRYYYPQFCLGQTNEGQTVKIVNQDCGGTYTDDFGSYDKRCFSNPYNNPNNLFGSPISTQYRGGNPVVFNSNNSDPNTCCIRNTYGSEPRLASNSECLNLSLCCYDDEASNPTNCVDPITNTGCYWTDSNGTIICKTGLETFNCINMCTNDDPTGNNCETVLCINGDNPPGCLRECVEGENPNNNCNYLLLDSDPTVNSNWICNGYNYPGGCTNMCTSNNENPNNCTVFTCDQFNTGTTPAGCVNICTSSVTTNCNYRDNDGNYICDSNNYPPGCIKACKGDVSDDPKCVSVNCSDYTDNGGKPPGCLQSCTKDQNPDDDNCYYNVNGTWVCNGNPPSPTGCKNLCTGDLTIDDDDCIIVNCENNIQNLPCINQCDDYYKPPNCAYYDSIDNKWICSNAGAENLPGCINICVDEKDTSNNCKRITCTSDQDADSPDCWEKNDGNTICTGGTNDASDCIWQTTLDNKNICKSINNPPGCVYLCDNAGKPPAWSIINTIPVCVNQTCDINNNPPGCNKAYVPQDGGNNNNEDGDGGNSILMWILIIFGILVFLALIGFLIYYFFLKKKDESDFDDLLKENTEENEDENKENTN